MYVLIYGTRAFLYGKLDLIVFYIKQATFIVAVTRCSRIAYYIIAVMSEFLCKRIDGFPAAQTERYMYKSRSV